ncbi:MAG TPA: choice-of-anchor tandem repeat GloVer-containing protein [Rhizomicrobium sp.]|nr:choice-of-anchor tandem repeat GloVer-containing protein [Rhizomicrobium sp.]
MRLSIDRLFETSAIALMAGGLIVVAPAGSAMAGKFKVLHSFCGSHDGCLPEGGLVMDQSGNFFGTTSEGGKHEAGHGTVYELQRTDSGRLRYKRGFSFCNRYECDPPIANPIGNLIVDTKGNLYGLTSDGQVFELSPPTGGSGKWTDKLLYQFCSQQNCADGYDPVGGLAYAGQSSGTLYDGTSPLYGATGLGGTNSAGTVYELTNSGGQWTETVLHDFCSQGKDKCTDGKDPAGGVLLDQAGNLYGLASEGGNTSGTGVAYELAPNGNFWSETVLYAFCAEAGCSDGAYPVGGLAMDAEGNLLGVTAGGGVACMGEPSGCGTIFKIVPNGGTSQESVLYTFCSQSDCRDGRGPQAGLIIGSSGELFGTTYFGGGNDIDINGLGGGVVFELSGSSYRVLHSFCSLSGCADGEYPAATLVNDTSGNVLGTAALGGSFGNGALFQLTP